MGIRNLRITFLAALVCILAAIPGLALAATPIGGSNDTPPCTGYLYTVQPGDTWWKVATRTGVDTTALVKANPQALRRNGWLYIGEQLCIPDQPKPEGHWYEVKAGDTWNTISRATGVPVRDLWRANPSLLDRKLWLYIGQRVWIPSITAAVTPVPSTTPGPNGPAPTEEPTAVEPTPEQGTPEPIAVEPTPEATPEPGAPEPTAEPGPPGELPGEPGPSAVGCPADLAGYPDALASLFNDPANTLQSVSDWLAACGAAGAETDGVTQASLQSADSSDLVVVLQDPAGGALRAGLLLVYHGSPNGYALVHRAESSGTAALLTTGDLNADGKADIVWTDTTCGAHTCFSALMVESWDGQAYQDWLADDATMAEPEVSFRDTDPKGAGAEILLHGGIIGSAGAGPQRAWTETYVSLQGQPYTFAGMAYDPSPCLYHAIVDANRAFADWSREGLEPVIAAYDAALADDTLQACGTVADEVSVLRDFARFRLVVAHVGQGQVKEAEALAGQIVDQPLRGAADRFLQAYAGSRSVVQACREATRYAMEEPDAWQFLADWGYANPTFTAKEFCPLQ